MYELNSLSRGTLVLEDYEIEDFTTLHVMQCIFGGGDPIGFYSYFDELFDEISVSLSRAI